MDFNRKFSISILLIICSICVSLASFVEKPNGHQKQVLHKTLTALLNFKSSPNEDGDGNARRPNNLRPNDAISRYMKELFKRYKSSEDTTFNTNTVRSFAPKIGSVDGQDAIIFNLHSLRPSEEIVRAEIHYNLGGPPKSQQWKEKKSKEIRCYRVISSDGDERNAPRRQELSQMTHSKDVANWLIFDAHDSVISLLGSSSSRKNVSQLAIVFAVQNQHSKRFKILSPRKAWRHHSPFLLIFTDDSRLIDSQKMMSAVLPNVETVSARYHEQEEQELDKNRVKRHLGGKDLTKYYQYSVDETTDSQKIEEKNHWNQVANHVRAFQEQGPSVLQDTKKLRRHRKIKPRKHDKIDSNIFSQKQTTPFGESQDEEKPKNDVSTIKQKQLFGQQVSSKLHENDATLVLLDDEPQQICQKRDLVVEFSDIGWGEWIIAPKSFEAHYCAGACPFPLPLNSNPSNHAVIQSIIHTVGMHPGVPQICCAPEKMDSLTLLYFDEEQNVVLKNYPKMTVSSCGCL